MENIENYRTPESDIDPFSIITCEEMEISEIVSDYYKLLYNGVTFKQKKKDSFNMRDNIHKQESSILNSWKDISLKLTDDSKEKSPVIVCENCQTQLQLQYDYFDPRENTYNDTVVLSKSNEVEEPLKKESFSLLKKYLKDNSNFTITYGDFSEEEIEKDRNLKFV